MPDCAAIVDEMLKLATHLEDVDGAIDTQAFADILTRLSEGQKTDDLISEFGLDEMAGV